mgnify:CR=1 FL=1
MSIFMLSPKAEEKEETAPIEVSAKIEKVEDTENKVMVPDTGYLTQKEIDEKTIILDGPLSKIYSEALNQAYAKESYVATEVTSIADTVNKKEANYTMQRNI